MAFDLFVCTFKYCGVFQDVEKRSVNKMYYSIYYYSSIDSAVAAVLSELREIFALQDKNNKTTWKE